MVTILLDFLFQSAMVLFNSSSFILTKDIKEYESASQIIPSNEFSLIIEATQTPKAEVINFLHDLYVLSATNSSSKDLKVS